MENWQNVLAKERAKSGNFRLMVIFTIIALVVCAGILYVYTVKPAMAEDYCMSLLNSHDSEVQTVKLTGSVIEDRDVKYGEVFHQELQTKKVVNLLADDGKAVDCQLSVISSKPSVISPSYSYKCTRGMFFFETRETMEYYFIAYQIYYDSGIYITRYHYISKQQPVLFKAVQNEIQDIISQGECVKSA